MRNCLYHSLKKRGCKFETNLFQAPSIRASFAFTGWVRYIRLKSILFILVLAGFFLSACNPIVPRPGTTQESPDATLTAQNPTATVTIAPSPSPSPTPVPSIVVFVQPEGADPTIAQQVKDALTSLTDENNLELEEKSLLDAADLTAAVRLVVAIAPNPDLQQLAAAAPQIQFLAVAIPDLTPTDNLTVLSSPSSLIENAGFLAGAIAAMITPDWRIGAVTAAGNPESTAAGKAFLNGGVYFCGLCRPVRPPYYDSLGQLIGYPTSVELPSEAGEQQQSEIVQRLVDLGVKTVYLTPRSDTDSLVSALSAAGIWIIASGTKKEGADHWAATLSMDLSSTIVQIWPKLLSGEAQGQLPLSLSITDVDSGLFTPGKQQLASKILKDLETGFINPMSPSE